MIYLLDTDTLSHLHRGRAIVVRRYEAMPAGDVAISVVTRIEMLRARFANVLKAADAAQLALAQQRLDETEHALRDWRVLGIEAIACSHFDRLRQVKSLRKIGRADLLIACIALAHSATLVTRNTRDFSQVSHLRLENWVD